MPRYFFSLKNGRPFHDVDGLELADIGAVRNEAVKFARDVMRMEPERLDWSQWAVCVTDDAQKSVFKLAFSEVA
jgi:hypothetical protein